MSPDNGPRQRVPPSSEKVWWFRWLFWFEIRNILIVNERRGRIGLADVERFIDELPKLTAEVDDEPDGPAAMSLAHTH
ncbi:MAG TPA: type II toxin-antitoxin system VapC family toxin, partial [Tepidisphaeraceae bacterium]|nr:type II toxin-antitoxin system VapC family toxin [Tepidisphaeraceae bacterium]